MIILIARVFPPKRGGIETMVYNLYSRLDRVRVITPEFKGSVEFDRSLDMAIERVSIRMRLFRRYKLPLIFLAVAAVKACRRRLPDQVHCDQVQSGIIGLLINKIWGVPYTVYAYGMEISCNRSTRMKSLVFNRADRVVAISSYTESLLKSKFRIPAEKIDLIYPGTDTDHFHPGVDCSDIRARYRLGNKKIILSVGRLDGESDYKNFDTVISLMPGILKVVPNAVYLIVGEGNDVRRLRQIAKTVGVAQEVIFAGAAGDNDLPKFYRAADLFVMVSKDKSVHGKGGGEGFGIVYAEAGACAIPVIAGDKDGAVDVVRDGANGLTVDPDDENKIADAIIRLLTDKRLATRLGRQGRKFVTENYRWDLSVAKLRWLCSDRPSDLKEETVG